MTRPPPASVVRYGIVALLVAAVISGYPAKWFRGSQSVQLRPPAERPALSDFTLPAIQGGKWRLGDNAGKVVLLNFWATWCRPCRVETPELVRIYDRYRGRGFEIAGITLDEEPQEVVPAFIRRYDVRYPVLLPPADFTLAAYVESLPTTLVLDKQGRVAGSWIGQVHESELTPAIEHLLAEAQ